jgi:tripartite-type tricarboxylate transporter receptor subunit TctC
MPELFKTMASVDLMHVPYRGTAALMNDLLGGQVQLTFSSMAIDNRLHQDRQTARARDNHCDAI